MERRNQKRRVEKRDGTGPNKCSTSKTQKKRVKKMDGTGPNSGARTGKLELFLNKAIVYTVLLGILLLVIWGTVAAFNGLTGALVG